MVESHNAVGIAKWLVLAANLTIVLSLSYMLDLLMLRMEIAEHQ
jgi:hypothetical protein